MGRGNRKAERERERGAVLENQGGDGGCVVELRLVVRLESRYCLVLGHRFLRHSVQIMSAVEEALCFVLMW